MNGRPTVELASFYNDLAITYFQIKEYDNAVESMKKVIEIYTLNDLYKSNEMISCL